MPRKAPPLSATAQHIAWNREAGRTGGAPPRQARARGDGNRQKNSCQRLFDKRWQLSKKGSRCFRPGLCLCRLGVLLPHIARRGGKALLEGPVEPGEVVEARVIRNGAHCAACVPGVGQVVEGALQAQLQQVVTEGGALLPSSTPNAVSG